MMGSFFEHGAPAAHAPPEDAAVEEEWRYDLDARHVLEDGDPAEALMLTAGNFLRKKKQHRCAAWGAWAANHQAVRVAAA